MKPKKIHITVTGDPGSGKSAVCRQLALMLGYKYFSTGHIQRELGKKKKLNTLELNYLAEKDNAIDRYIDERVKKINDEPVLYVIDSRLAWHFIKKSFRVFLKVDPAVAAKRVAKDRKRKSEPTVRDIKERSLNLLERKNAENKRFEKKYGVDCCDMNNYDLVIDTSKLKVKEIAGLIRKAYKGYLEKKSLNG
ncbi:MAG: AAA family ATPase [Bacteroidetes bacterium]|nr:AAA family ATPase [Bacteroidota bacterium]